MRTILVVLLMGMGCSRSAGPAGPPPPSAVAVRAAAAEAAGSARDAGARVAPVLPREVPLRLTLEALGEFSERPQHLGVGSLRRTHLRLVLALTPVAAGPSERRYGFAVASVTGTAATQGWPLDRLSGTVTLRADASLVALTPDLAAVPEAQREGLAGLARRLFEELSWLSSPEAVSVGGQWTVDWPGRDAGGLALRQPWGRGLGAAPEPARLSVRLLERAGGRLLVAASRPGVGSGAESAVEAGAVPDLRLQPFGDVAQLRTDAASGLLLELRQERSANWQFIGGINRDYWSRVSSRLRLEVAR